MVFKPPVTPPYATRVPGRSAGEFKTHSTFGQAKQAIANYPNWSQGAALHDLEVLRLDTHQDEYLPWIKINRGDRYVDHPQILPGAPDPDDPYLAFRAASKLVGIPEARLKQYVEAGTLKSYGVRHLTRLKRADLLALKAANELTRMVQEEVCVQVEAISHEEAHTPDGRIKVCLCGNPEEGYAADNIAGFYGGQLAPLPDGVVPVSQEELEEADRYGEQVNAPLDQGTIDALNERIAAGDLPVRTVRPVKIAALPEPTEGERKFPEYTEAELDAAFDTPEVIDPLKAVTKQRIAEAKERASLVPVSPGVGAVVHVAMGLPVEEIPNERTREAIRRLETVVERAPAAHELGEEYAAKMREARKSFLGRLDAARNPSDVMRVDKVCRLLSEAYQLTAGLRMDLQPDPGPDGPLPDLYPLTVLRSRYNGTYEGAKWVAFKDRPDIVQDALGDDMACSSFFRVYGSLKPIGRGDSPEAAVRDLDKQVSS